MGKKYFCTQCPLRKRYDKNPKSVLGSIWRWHITFCPGWKAYFTSLTEVEKEALRAKYNFHK